MARKIKILVADDHAIFRHGLKDILAQHFSGAVVGEAETGRGAVEQVRKAKSDIVVLDVTMPGQSGIEALHEIRQFQPALRVLILSMHPEEQYARRLLQAGAAGYITKMNAPLAIVDAVKCVLAGGQYISPALAQRTASQANPGAELLAHDRLSRREFQVMRLIPLGKSLKAIAGELAVSIQTVSTHRTRILKKMGLRTNADLIRYAVENQLVD
jgi:two-component system, NarL family, invasion response regulator UvrY